MSKKYTLNEYVDALTYRNKDVTNGKLGKGIVQVVKENRKKRSSKSLGLIKSIISEFVQFEEENVDGEIKLAVTKINIPNDLKPAFLPKNSQFLNSTKEK